MNKETDEKLDQLFRKGMENPDEPAFRSADWEAMEQMLDQGKKRSGIIYWLPIIGSAAALVLVFLGYLFLNPVVTKPKKSKQLVTVKHAADSNAYTKRKDTADISSKTAQQIAKNDQRVQFPVTRQGDKEVVKESTESSKSLAVSSSSKRRAANKRNSMVIAGFQPHNERDHSATQLTSSDNGTPPKEEVIAKTAVPTQVERGTTNDRVQLGTADDRVQLGTADDRVQLGTADDKKDNPNVNTLASATVKTEKVNPGAPQKQGSRPQFGMTVLASSDLNGVNSSFQRSKVGGNFGAIFSVSLKKWTISTGASYDIKPYWTSFSNYHLASNFATRPQSVSANCRMIDIPINLNYQVYSYQNNKITLGTGLSSYFMLREDYQFNYNGGGLYGSTLPPSKYTVINKNRNILSVMNLDASYTHQINAKVGITVQPYLKVPLSNVGASQVRLQSTGVALGFNWNFNSSSKPK